MKRHDCVTGRRSNVRVPCSDGELIDGRCPRHHEMTTADRATRKRIRAQWARREPEETNGSAPAPTFEEPIVDPIMLDPDKNAAQTRRLNLQNAQAMGKMMDVDTVSKMVKGWMGIIRTHVDQAPARLKQKRPGLSQEDFAAINDEHERMVSALEGFQI